MYASSWLCTRLYLRLCPSMSVTLHYSQIREPDLLDVVDDAWAQDKLPNDDIPLPEGLVPPVDETDDLREELEAQNKGPDKWVELGLHTVH
ncbi:Anaphase-promoting complex subunit 13 [Trebouxia sp. C0010 RCD-2024]